MKQVRCQITLAILSAAALPALASGQGATGQVIRFQEISEQEGGSTPALDDYDRFGSAVTALGDLNGDGICDLAVGACEDDDGAIDAGAIYILFLRSDATVSSYQKISNLEGNFPAWFSSGSRAGSSLAALGDLNGDDLPDLAVGAPKEEFAGAVWILCLNPDGTVKQHQKISQTRGNFAGSLDPFGSFGFSMAHIGDLDHDGNPDLAVGAPHANGIGVNRGEVWLLGLQADGNVNAYTKISGTEGGFQGDLDNGDQFGSSICALGDLSDDGIPDILVGASKDDDGATNAGAAWLLILRHNGEVSYQQKISATTSDLPLDANSLFGGSAAAIGDLDHNGMVDLAIGAPANSDGHAWVLLLHQNLTVLKAQRIQGQTGNFTAELGGNHRFGWDITCLGDLDGDERVEVSISASQIDKNGTNRGAVYTLTLSHGPWLHLGPGLAGQSGEPGFDPQGSLVGGELIDISVSNLPPRAMSFLLLGFSELSLPYRGGILVPNFAAPGVILRFRADQQGEIPLITSWPEDLPAGFTVYLQFWTADPSAPLGFSATPGYSGTTPFE